MKIAKFIATSMGLAVASYLAFGFISWHWNPGEWAKVARVFAVTSWFMGSFISAGILVS